MSADLTTRDLTLTSLLRHLPREFRAFVAAVDALREGWDNADGATRHELWSAVDDAKEAVRPSIDPSLKRVLDDVIAERERQDERWGVQDIHDWERISIIGEEFGEVAKAANEANFQSSPKRGDRTELRSEAVQLAASVVDLVQAIDRRPAP